VLLDLLLSQCMVNFKIFLLFNFLGRYGRIISLLSCFAGGVFMGTGLLHLFPEVNEMLSKVLIMLTLCTN